MLHFPRWKIIAITLSCVFGVLLAVPSLLPPAWTSGLPGWMRPTVNLGLDLAGGSQLLLEAETSGLMRQRLDQMEDSVRQVMRQNNIEVAEVSTANDQVSFVVRNPAQLEAAGTQVRNLANPGGALAPTREWDVRQDGNRIILTQTDAGRAAALDNAMNVAREVIDRRINALGTLEPTILREGGNRILVQVPGLQDPEALKTLIGRTARLEFKMVDLTVTAEQLQQNRVPAGSQILPMTGGGTIAVQRRALISGDQIADARQDFGQSGEPVVTIRFDGVGGSRFAKATQQNVGRPFAIILDNVVLSAPNINEPILGGSAQISGSFTVESANELAISLRSGRLPVELTVVDERTVSPELGADSIQLGIIATIIGALLVILFMVATYGKFGLFANVALMLNVLIILGVMALIGATLTLPGIAGFVLTIGAAVDANIIINERIREEMRKGRSVLDAIDNGWKEASTAILDANITNAIAGALMLTFGSGPVAGFAVVLIIGIITSAYTAITVARMMVAIWVRRYRPKTLVL